MKITVKLGAPLSQVVGESKLILTVPEGVTLADVFDELKNRYPEFEAGLKGKGLRRLAPDSAARGQAQESALAAGVIYTVFVNARPAPLAQAATIHLRDGDRLSLFLPVAGG